MNYYFYAKESKTIINKVTGEEYLFLKVPIIVTDETETVNGEKVMPVKIGGWHLPCYYDWIPAEYYLDHKRDIETQAKAASRASRCLIDDGKGGRVRCPDCRSCIGCPNAEKFDFDNGHDASFDGLQENGFDAESGEEKESDFDATDTCFANPESELLRKNRQETLTFSWHPIMVISLSPDIPMALS